MKLNLKHYEIDVTLEVDEDSDIRQVVNYLIIPALRAIGFADRNIDDVLVET